MRNRDVDGDYCIQAVAFDQYSACNYFMPFCKYLPESSERKAILEILRLFCSFDDHYSNLR